jgi:hypothetical protein
MKYLWSPAQAVRVTTLATIGAPLEHGRRLALRPAHLLRDTGLPRETGSRGETGLLREAGCFREPGLPP